MLPNTWPHVATLDHSCHIVLDKVARALDESQIPDVLGPGWNSLILRSMGSNEVRETDIPLQAVCLILTFERRLSFVVSDEQVPKAINVIAEAGLEACTHEGCCHSRPFRRPITEKHFHFDSASILHVLKKSAFYWALPDLPAQMPSAGDPIYVLSNDPRLEGSFPAVFPTHLHPLKLLTPTALIESLMLLMCRDIRSGKRV